MTGKEERRTGETDADRNSGIAGDRGRIRDKGGEIDIYETTPAVRVL